MLDTILDPLQYPFMVRGVLAASMVGLVCSIIGCYIVLQGMAFLGSALSHAILPGVALGYIVSGGDTSNIFWWALAASILTVFGIGLVTRQGEVKEDTAIGVLFAGMFALGIAIISSERSYAVDLTHFLFGNVLGVSNYDLLLTGGFGFLVLLLVGLFYKEFLVVSFDPTLAETVRIRPYIYRYLLLIMIAVTIVISLQTVGIALMIAMLVTPAAAAFLLTRHLLVMMGISALIGVLSSVSGLYISFYVNVASGAAMVLTCTAVFIVAFLFAPHRGWLWQQLRHQT